MNTHFTKALVVALGLVVLSSCQPATSTTSQQSQSATLIVNAPILFVNYVISIKTVRKNVQPSPIKNHTKY